MKKPATKPEQTLSKFGEASYPSPQTAIMAKMGQKLPRMEPEPTVAWSFVMPKGTPKKRKR